MTARKPRVPRTLDQLVALAEKDDCTPAELERLRIGAVLLLADEIRSLRAAMGEVAGNTAKCLEIVLKQHGRLLLDATDRD